MTNPFMQAEVAPVNSFQFNGFESAVPSALRETPMVLDTPQITPQITSDALPQIDTDQSQPFEITDGDRVVASSCPGGCPCCEYSARGWNRSATPRTSYQPSYSSCDDGSCDDGDDYSPNGDCDDGDCGPGNGPLRGLLGRFGRGGLLGRLLGGGGLARGFRF